ncbi:putative transcription factor Hap3/NF-YB family [Helianthus anomalus]
MVVEGLLVGRGSDNESSVMVSLLTKREEPSFNPFLDQGPASPDGGGSDDNGEDLTPRSSNVREQDQFLPSANISPIMKKRLPSNGKMSKEAKETV